MLGWILSHTQDTAWFCTPEGLWGSGEGTHSSASVCGDSHCAYEHAALDRLSSPNAFPDEPRGWCGGLWVTGTPADSIHTSV